MYKGLLKRKMEPIKALYVDGVKPVQYFDEESKEAKGIFIDVMNLISKRTGIKFDFIKTTTYNEAYELLKSGQADMLISSVNNYSIADK